MPWLALLYGVLLTPPLILLGIGYPNRFPARRTRWAATALLLVATALPILGILWAAAVDIYYLLITGQRWM